MVGSRRSRIIRGGFRGSDKVLREMASAQSSASPRPFLKWAGGKTQLLGQFAKIYPAPGRITGYIEPFVGSGSVFFQVKSLFSPEQTILADSNEELINAYRTIRDDLSSVVRALRRHKSLHRRDHYYRVRAQDPSRLSDASRAARLIYLNKTCFNGLYRVNNRGRFNVPMGRYRDPRILDEENLRGVSAALRGVKLMRADFEMLAGYARPGDFIYLDPPYHPISVTSSFTSYTEGSFKVEDQRKLARVFRELHERGCFLMLSNSDASLVRELYDDPRFRIRRVAARRTINSNPKRRGRVSELVVTNYEPARSVSTGPAPPFIRRAENAG